MRRTELKRRPRAAASPEVRAMHDAWRLTAGRLPCAVCGSRINVVGHHVVPLQWLKRMGVDEDVWYALDWMLPLCQDPSPGHCHERHELAYARVPWSVVRVKAPRALSMARSFGVADHEIRRMYADA